MSTNTPHQFETAEERRDRWEAAAHEAGREVDRNALAAYMAVADAEQRALADDWARSVASTDAKLADQRTYEQRLREQHDLDVAELNRLRARLWELERPAVEAKRAEVRDSYLQLAAQCRDDRDFEGAFDVDYRLREREEQWKAEDAANQPEVPAAPDTLPAWLYQRFAVIHGCPPWDRLTDSDRDYWEHQAAAVRRAVARGGFKTPIPPADGNAA